MPVKVKICGLKTPEAVDAVAAAGADFAGFVFYPPSPRAISLDDAAALGARLPDGVARVALTVDGDDDLVAAIVARLKPEYIQAHGAETPERVRAIAEKFARPVIKAIKVGEARDVELAAAYRGAAEMILFDAKAPDGRPQALPGGNGMAFDWTLLVAASHRDSYILSGGLDEGNVARALAITDAPVVDVSSGVESAPGIKDTSKIQRFVDAVRAVEVNSGEHSE